MCNITLHQQVQALVLPLMLLWDQYSGLAWILQPSSCSKMWKHTVFQRKRSRSRWEMCLCECWGVDRWELISPLWWAPPVLQGCSPCLCRHSWWSPPWPSRCFCHLKGERGLLMDTGGTVKSPAGVEMKMKPTHSSALPQARCGRLCKAQKCRAVSARSPPRSPGFYSEHSEVGSSRWQVQPCPPPYTCLWKQPRPVKERINSNSRHPSYLLPLRLMSNLKNGRVHLLVVVLFAGVFPRDSEQCPRLILPLQPRVLRALDLLHQPLFQSPTSRVRHFNPGKTT